MEIHTQPQATVNIGIGLGSVLAMLISWGYTRSVFWTLLHGFFGWIYVMHAFIVKRVRW